MTDKLLIGASLLGMTVLNGTGLNTTPVLEHTHSTSYPTEYSTLASCNHTKAELAKRFNLTNFACRYANP